MKVQLIFSNKSSDLNKKLIKFFNLNLLNLNKASLTFDFEVAHPENLEHYVSKGIKNYPILINNDTNVIGVEKIISYLKLHVKKHNDSIINKSDNDRVNDFWKSTLGNVKIDSSGNAKVDDDDDDEEDEMHRKIQKAFDARNTTTAVSSAKHPTPQRPRMNNIQQGSNLINKEKTPAETAKSMNTGNNMDDELMAKFFENQEETL